DGRGVPRVEGEVVRLVLLHPGYAQGRRGPLGGQPGVEPGHGTRLLAGSRRAPNQGSRLDVLGLQSSAPRACGPRPRLGPRGEGPETIAVVAERQDVPYRFLRPETSRPET